MNKYLKTTLILIFGLAILSIVPATMISKVVSINNKVIKNIYLKFKKNLKNTFNFEELQNWIKNKEVKKDFFLYIGGNFCSHCKKINQELDKTENAKIKNESIKKIYFEKFKVENFEFNKDFRKSEQWKIFIKKINEEYEPKNKLINTMVVPFFIYFKYNDTDKKYKIEWMDNLTFESLKRKIESLD